MRYSVLAAAMLALMLIGRSAADAQETLRIGTEGAYPPWNARLADGSLVGLDIDLGHALCAEMEVDCTFLVQDWSGIIPALNAGRYDAIISSMSITDERDAQIDFTNPYVDVPRQFVTTEGSDLAGYRTMEEIEAALAGRRIGVQSGTISSRYVERHFPNAEIILYDDYDKVMLDLRAGRIDASFANVTIWDAYGQDGGLVTFGPLIPASSDPGILGRGMAIGVREGDDALKGRFNRALQALDERGELQDIVDEWLGADYSVSQP